MRAKYTDYLKSPEWKKIRNSVLERDNFRCAVCGSTDGLNIHHITYENIFNEQENLSDLVTLCRKCHETIHSPHRRTVYQHDSSGRCTAIYLNANDASKKLGIPRRWITSALRSGQKIGGVYFTYSYYMKLPFDNCDDDTSDTIGDD